MENFIFCVVRVVSHSKSAHGANWLFQEIRTTTYIKQYISKETIIDPNNRVSHQSPFVIYKFLREYAKQNNQLRINANLT